jgi:hypothetical protein
VATTTRARAARSSLGAAAALLLLGSAGCSREGPDRTCASAAEATAEVVAPGDVPTVDESSANLVLDVSSTSAAPVRVTVTFDDVPALDVSAPGTPEVCAHGPVHRYGYELPTGPTVVEVTTDGGQTGAVEVAVGERPQWVVVGVQEDFPLRVDLWQERPAYG